MYKLASIILLLIIKSVFGAIVLLAVVASLAIWHLVFRYANGYWFGEPRAGIK